MPPQNKTRARTTGVVPELSIDDVLAADDLPSEFVETPEWGGKVKVRALSRAAAVRTLEESKVVVETEDGDRIEGYDDAKWTMLLVIAGMGLTADRYEQLNQKHSAPLKRIAAKVKELSGLTSATFPE